jgi:polysaccharide pyruvyl transferase WcaK-like protein
MKRIGIAGYYGVGNLGDETVVAILIAKIRQYYPDAELFGFSLNPADTERRHGIKSYPIRLRSEVPLARNSSRTTIPPRHNTPGKLKQSLKRLPFIFKPLKRVTNCLHAFPPAIRELAFLGRSFHRLRGCDLLVVPGSGALTDWWGGAWVHPYSLLSWSCLARMTRTKVIALSIGSERLNTRLGKTFCKWALSLAHYRSFRDQYSRDFMEAAGLPGKNPVFPDQGFALADILSSSPRQTTRPKCEQTRPGLVVGVCPIGKTPCVGPGEDESWHDAYLASLCAVLSWLLRKGHRIAFSATDNHDAPCVQQIIDRIIAASPDTDVAGQLTHEPISTTADLIEQIGACDLMITSRFHGVVLSLALYKPVLAITAYASKIRDVMSQCDLGDYCLTPKEAGLERMLSLFHKLEQNRSAIAHRLERLVEERRANVNRQYDQVLGTWEG